MKALAFGLILMAAAAAAALPQGLNWIPYILVFIRGGLPIVTALLGFLIFFIGLIDLKDRAQTRKEDKEAENT